MHFRRFTAWYPVYALVPGAPAVRAISRFIILVDFPLILIAVWALDGASRRLPVPLTAEMLVATYDNLSTINGRSSVVPPDWNSSYPGIRDYPVRVRRYEVEHHLSRLWGLDFENRHWSAPTVAAHCGIALTTRLSA
ncbi:MAG: hypothetical protein ACREFO_17175, partial [Acetobacteraceae bacterium]